MSRETGYPPIFKYHMKLSFFQRLFEIVDLNVTSCPMKILFEILPKTLPNEAQLELVRQIISEEVKATMFAIEGEKASGPNR